MQLSKNFKMGASLSVAGILLGLLTFSTIDKFNVSSAHVSSVIKSPLKSAESNVYKQFLDLYLTDYKNQNNNFKSHGDTNCFVKEDNISCSVDNLLFSFIDSTNKENSLSVEKITINNIKDFKTKMDLITNKSSDTSILLKPDFKSSFDISFSNIKINNQSQSDNIIKTIKEQSIEKQYSESDINLLSEFVNKHLNVINLNLKDQSIAEDNKIKTNTELTISSNTLNIGASIDINLSHLFIELISKKDIDKMNPQEFQKFNSDKMNELVINNLSFNFNTIESNFINNLLAMSLNIESDSNLSQEDLLKQLDLSYAQILTVVNNSQLNNQFKEDFKNKLINISEGKTSNISISLNNVSKQNLNKTLSLFMQANMIKDISVLNPHFLLTIK